ncbi:class I SAM-dependent methyltransferase [Lentzea tibetensis]|uniref:Class I SAM-dependent methyltransferase n=1 Tax=Lentzea tibetensis TaxID=2591470 RepID=A0A563EQA3_9PSEU|nr:class I SAM-dependent methyltransferase [Lentzea tibetensis]TWP49576.1 class I SAM-dependent methyltransferase [Lentzea tibetensis]
MGMIEYDRATAESFRAARELPLASLTAWREVLTPFLVPGTTVLDLGAGTGLFTRAFREWFDVEVIAVEPSADMRAVSGEEMLAGDAARIPLPDGSVDVVWMSTVVHHVPDLAAAGREIRRVLRDGSVLIRGVFPGRTDRLGLLEHFPEAARGLARFPTVEGVADGLGFDVVSLEPVPQQSAESLRDKADGLRRDADTLLRGLTDEEFERGLERLRHAAATAPSAPVIDYLDFLVLS